MNFAYLNTYMMKYFLLSTLLISCAHNQIMPKTDNLKIAVIDTGVDFNHELLKDFKSPYQNPNGAIDVESHGTHVAGIIASYLKKANVKNVEIVSYQAIHETGNVDDVLNQMIQAVKDNSSIVNISVAGLGFNQKEYNLMKNNPQVKFVVSAGNFGPTQVLYPCNYNLENVICVGNLDNKKINPTSGTKNVAVFAQGTNIKSSIPNNQYAVKTGSSQSTPVISAYMAVKKLNPSKIHIFKDQVFFKKTDIK